MSSVVMFAALVLLVVAGWLRASGTAITRVPRADALRDQSDGRSGSGVVADLLEDREVISPAVGVVASGLLVIGAALAAVVLAEGHTTGWAMSVAAAIGVVFFLIGDLVPRRLGRLNSASLAYRSARLLSVAVALGGWANDLLPDPDDLGEVADIDEETSDEQERELIDSVLEFAETIVREVMTPRPDMITIGVTGTIEELIEVSTQVGYSRIPVTSDGDIVGMVIVKDLLSMLTNEDSKPKTVAQVMRPVEFVPENKLVSSLLSEMQDSHTHQVIAVDEFGDVVGLVTIEDLLEELVGEIADETDPEEAMIVERADGWLIDGRLTVDEFAKLVEVEALDYEGDTVGGLVLGLAERVPEEGERFELEGLDLRVTRMQGRRVAEVHVTQPQRIESA